MNNTELSKKIKELRLSKAYSQEHLANVSGLSLRTIQRIENGETEPRGDTLSRLAQALGVTPNDLVEWTEVEDKRFLLILNISAFSFVFFPLMGVVMPLIFWMMKKDKVRSVDAIGKKILNFQVTFCVLIFSWYLLYILSIFFGLHLDGTMLPQFKFMNLGMIELIIIVVPAICYIYNFGFVLYNCFKLYRSGTVYYAPAIRLFK